MSNPATLLGNVKLEFGNKDGNNVFQAISKELNSAIGEKGVLDALNATIQNLTGISIVTNSEIIDSTAAQHDFSKDKGTLKMEISDDFVKRLSEISGKTIDKHALATGFSRRLRRKLNTTAKNLKIDIDQESSPTQTKDKKLTKLNDTIIANLNNPQALFATYLSANLPELFDRSFTPNTRLNISYAVGDYEKTVQSLDTSLVQLLSTYAFALDEQLKTGALTEDSMYKYLADLALEIAKFRAEFVRDTVHADYGNNKPFASTNSGIADLLAAASERIQSGPGTAKTTISSLEDPSINEIIQTVNEGKAKKIDANGPGSKTKIDNAAWSPELDLNRIINEINNSLGSTDLVLTDEKISGYIDGLVDVIMLKGGDDRNEQIATYLKFNEDKGLDPAKDENRFAQRLHSAFRSRIFSEFGLPEFEAEHNPFSESFDPVKFLDALSNNKEIFNNLQETINKLSENSKDSNLSEPVRAFYKAMFDELNSLLTNDASKIISIRNDIHKKIASNSVTPNDHRTLQTIEDIGLMFKYADKKGIGLGFKQDLSEKEARKGIEGFAREFEKVSKERSNELERRMRELIRQRGRSQAERDQIKAEFDNTNNERAEVEATLKTIRGAIKLATRKVDEIYAFEDQIQRKVNRIEGAFDRYKSMEYLRNRIFGDVSGKSGGIKFAKSLGVGLVTGATSAGFMVGLTAVNPIFAGIVATTAGFGGSALVRKLWSGADARAQLYRENINSADQKRTESLTALFEQEQKIEAVRQNIVEAARMFDYYNENKGGISTEEKYKILSSIWEMSKPGLTPDNEDLDQYVAKTAETLNKSHAIFQNHISRGNGRGFTRSQKNEAEVYRQQKVKNDQRQAFRTNAARRLAPRQAGGQGITNPLISMFRRIFG